MTSINQFFENGGSESVLRGQIRFLGFIAGGSSQLIPYSSVSIYDIDNLETHLVMPARGAASTPSGFQTFTHHYVLTDDSTNLRKNFGVDINSKQNTSQRSNIYEYDDYIVLPLANRTLNGIQFVQIFDEQSVSNRSTDFYAGVIVDGRPLTERIRSKTSVSVRDQFGFFTQTLTENTNRTRGFNRYIYDNDKNCLLVVEMQTNELVEIYADGVVRTGLIFNDNSEYQAYVDSIDSCTICMLESYRSSALSPDRFSSTTRRDAGTAATLSAGHSYHYIFENGRLEMLKMIEYIDEIIGSESAGSELVGYLDSTFILERQNGERLVHVNNRIVGSGGLGARTAFNFGIATMCVHPKNGNCMFMYDGLYLNNNISYGLVRAKVF